MRIFVLVIAILFLNTLNLYSGEWSNKAFKTEDGFEITLTDKWIEMPEDVLSRYSERANKLQKAMDIRFAYGFQRKGTKWFEWPFIVITIDESGKFRESEFKNTKQLKKSIKEGSDIVKKSLEGLADNITLGEPYYDPNLKIFYQIANAKNPKQGQGIDFFAAKLTNKGVIKLHCLTKENESDVYIPFFIKVAESIKLDSSLKYK